MANCYDTPCAPLPCKPPCPPKCNCTTDEVIYKGIDDVCTGILTDQTLTEVLNRLRTYSQNRLFQITSDSMVVTPLPSTCEKISQIEIVPSTDAGNIFVLGTDGYPYVPDNSGGGGTPFSCSDISTTFVTDTAQKNTIDPTLYDILISGTAGCQKLSPPTGFAVTGNTRVSAFGKMEWYSTLTLANAAAITGETVLIYNDTNEILTVKAGVNYFGVGQHSIQALIASVSGITQISNLTFQQNSSINSGTIYFSNSNFVANLSISGTGAAEGFSINSELSSLVVTGSGSASKFRVNCGVSITDNAKISYGEIINTNPDLPGLLGLLTITGSGENTASASHCVIKSTANVGLYAITPSGNISISNFDIETAVQTAAYLHNGGTSDTPTGSSLIANHINARNIGVPNSGTSFGNPCVNLVSNAPLSPAGGSGKSALATNISAYSVSGAGINLTGFGMKHCYGFSIDHAGISAFSEDNRFYKSEIVECVGESRNYHGGHFERDIYISGGTFITRSTSASFNPLMLGDDGTPNGNYYIAGTKTIARNTSAFGITASNTVTARISGCQFLNENLATLVPGIDTTNITLQPVTIDAYGNIT